MISLPVVPAALIRSYVDCIHNYNPFLELADFVFSINTSGQGKMLSLLVYQAVMFAAAAVADIEGTKCSALDFSSLANFTIRK
jgi:hypothetical protein